MVDYSPGVPGRSLVQQGPHPALPGGELHVELADGRVSILTPGLSYQVADEAEPPHRSVTATGARLFIVD